MCKVLPPRLFHWTIFPTLNLHTINNLRTLSNLNMRNKLHMLYYLFTINKLLVYISIISSLIKICNK